jgi:CRISPR-associated protein Csh1
MLRALQELGEYLIEHENRGGLSDYLSIDKLDSEETLLAVQFAANNGDYVYDGVTVYDLEGQKEDILYLKDWHNTHDETPTSKIHRIDTLEEKDEREGAVRNDAIDWIFEGWFENEIEGDEPLVQATQAEYESKEATIRADTKEQCQSADDPDSCVLTVQYERADGEMHFIGDFDLFVEAVRTKAAENWAEKHSTTSSGEDERCTLCHEQREEVFGFAFPLPLYTVDNRKYAPDFEQADSWQNIPVCGDCALELRVAVNFIEDESFSFYLGDTIEYYIIPNFPLEGPVDDELMSAVVEGTGTDRQYSFMQAEGIYETYEEPDYPLMLDLVFYTTSQSNQQVERYVRNVEPPWIRKADQTLREVYDNIYGQGELAAVDYELDDPESLKQLDRLIYNTLPGIKDDSYADPEAYWSEALALLEAILKGDQVNYDRLLSIFDDELRSRFRNDGNYRGYVLRVFLLLTFLNRLDILPQDEVNSMQSYEEIMSDWGENAPGDLERFFNEFPDAFEQPAKRAVFVEGVLAQHLMDVQSQVRSGDPPLRKQLSGLRFTTDRAREFLPRLFRDIDAYDRKSDYPVEYRNLREAAATYFTQADANEWSISDEEVRYYFTLGMSLNRVFKSDSEETDDESPIPESIQES